MRARLITSGGLATALGVLVAVAGSVVVAFSSETVGDYGIQVAPAVNALAEGRVADFFQLQPVYGSFSALVRAPLTAVALQFDAGSLLIYRLGALVCLLPLGLVGFRLASRMAEREQSAVLCVAACALTVMNPATFAAVENGHPEDLLAAALVIAAVLAAIDRRGVRTGILLGLALVTKQWAALAVLPVLLVSAAAGRVRVALTALTVVAALALPLAVASPERYSSNLRATQGSTEITSRYSVWWPLSSVRKEVVRVGNEARSVVRHRLSPLLTGAGRPLVVALSVVLVFLYARRSNHRAPEDVFALLALILLLRCILDPLNNFYYHVPFLLSLVAWEALRRSGLPVVSVLTGAALWASFNDPLLAHAALNNAFYLSWGLSAAVWLACSLYAPDRVRATVPPPGAGGPFAVRTGSPTIHARNA
jgi:hypothetical protein